MARGTFFDMMCEQGDQLPSRAQNFLALAFPDGMSSAQVIEAADMTIASTQRIASYIESARPFWIVQTLQKNAAGATIGIKNEYTETKPSFIPADLGAALGV